MFQAFLANDRVQQAREGEQPPRLLHSAA